MGRGGEERIERTRSLFIDDLKTYQKSYRELEVVNEMIVKPSTDTGTCYGVKKCAEIVFRKVKMIKVEGLVVLEETVDALDQTKIRFTNFLDANRQIKSI